MNTSLRLLPCLVVLACCAAPAPPDPAFDGSYSGVSVRTRGGDTCGPRSEPVAVTVRGGVFSYGVPVTRPDIGNSLTPVDASLTQGGKVAGATPYDADNPLLAEEIQHAWANIEGQVSNGRIEANATSLNCGRHLSLLKTASSGPA
jgi:hypothetical protein